MVVIRYVCRVQGPRCEDGEFRDFAVYLFPKLLDGSQLFLRRIGVELHNAQSSRFRVLEESMLLELILEDWRDDLGKEVPEGLQLRVWHPCVYNPLEV